MKIETKYNIGDNVVVEIFDDLGEKIITDGVIENVHAFTYNHKCRTILRIDYIVYISSIGNSIKISENSILRNSLK